jgi:hypothetical protein
VCLVVRGPETSRALVHALSIIRLRLGCASQIKLCPNLKTIVPPTLYSSLMLIRKCISMIRKRPCKRVAAPKYAHDVRDLHLGRQLGKGDLSAERDGEG